MTSNCYIIDTSSLIQLNKHNPMDIYEKVWSNIDQLIHGNRLMAPKEVYYEIVQYDDTLKNWAKTHKMIFKEPTVRQMEIIRNILKQFPTLIDTDRVYDADPWVIALAIELKTNPQQTLQTIKRIIVTEERLRGNRVRIPLVCKDFSIESIDILKMFRLEGWKF